MVGIYKITNPKGKIYIGQSINIKYRLSKYKILNCKGQIILYRSFLKYGVENHIFEIIEECEKHLLNERERYYQDMFECLGSNGLNCVLTESSLKPRIISEETRLKIGMAHKGKVNSKETREKISASIKGKYLGVPKSEETKARMSIAAMGHKRLLGNKHSEYTKSKMSAWQTGRKLNENHCKNIGLSKKGVSCNNKIILDICNGVFHIGIKDASNSCNIKATTLKSMLNGRRKNKTNFIYV